MTGPREWYEVRGLRIVQLAIPGRQMTLTDAFRAGAELAACVQELVTKLGTWPRSHYDD